ncbi:VWA domain-containing protein [Psychrobacillus lasiicapitis]|uniref:VWA domain-containing protein n=1 Tax=Psychrobacillus lasiicapitis TaxID=1636719 RepID=A0A544TEJ6_9BACI|nr:VWA domain-containing protein [Psychrobacillus lasiicapitis]TQR15850.1 VWA domain-containing protein [Psychrobacillus lasiicapitis]GGA17571.1 chloride channel protein [Psychrobacillus lasiicapitis]
MDLRVDQPLWLLLLIPIVIYFVWTWKKEKKGFRKEGRVVFFLRLLAIFCLILGLTNPYLLLPIKEEQVLFLVDRSASVQGTDNQVTSFIEQSLTSRKNTQLVGVYTFAEDFQSEVALTAGEVNLPVFTPMKAPGNTDIARALQLATGIVETSKATRIVLFTDGLETSGSVQDELLKIAGGNVTIDVVQLERVSSEDVAITSFETPPIAFEGEQQQLNVQLEATTNTNGELLLYENDQLLSREQITLEQGANSFTFRNASSGEGLLKYEVQVVVSGDGLIENNKLTSVTNVESSPHLLVVTHVGNHSNIPTVIDQAAIQTDVIDASALPFDLSNYLRYDAIIFDNVPGHAVGEQKMTVIEQAVKNFGVGFMMVGGTNSFGLGGYFKTPIEKLLPVEMEIKGKHQMPSLGLVIVMDRSGSMSGSKFEYAKEAAARSVEMLREGDNLGFIAFDDRPWEIIETAPLSDKQEALDTILSVGVGGGTEIYSSLALAYEKLAPLKLQRKHVILLTDGQSAASGDYQTLIEEGSKDLITVSTVAVGQDADRALLESLAEMGGGTFYDVADESTIPAIMSTETAMISRTYIEDNPFYPIIYGDAAWTSLFTDGVPQMNAYIATTPKQTASIIAESEKEDPVLVEWMYGLGRTIAFTSDSTGEWSGDFARWNNWGDFWNTAVSRLLPAYSEVPFTIQKASDGSYTVTDPSGKSSFLEVAAVNEKGEELPVTSEPLAPGKSRVTVESDPGLVFFRVSNEQDAVYQAGISIPYSEEYKVQKPNTNKLEMIANRAGGKMLTDASEVFRTIDLKSSERQSIQQMLILAAILLFFVDITIRRFGFRQLLAPFNMKGKKKKTVETTASTSNVEKLVNGKKKR